MKKQAIFLTMIFSFACSHQPARRYPASLNSVEDVQQISQIFREEYSKKFEKFDELGGIFLHDHSNGQYSAAQLICTEYAEKECSKAHMLYITSYSSDIPHYEGRVFPLLSPLTSIYKDAGEIQKKLDALKAEEEARQKVLNSPVGKAIGTMGPFNPLSWILMAPTVPVMKKKMADAKKEAMKNSKLSEANKEAINFALHQQYAGQVRTKHSASLLVDTNYEKGPMSFYIYRDRVYDNVDEYIKERDKK